MSWDQILDIDKEDLNYYMNNIHKKIPEELSGNEYRLQK